MGQAIITKYSHTSRGGRISAKCYRGKTSVAYDHGLNVQDNHQRAAQALVDKLNGMRDAVQVGLLLNPDDYTDACCGEMPDGSGYAFIVRLV